MMDPPYQYITDIVNLISCLDLLYVTYGMKCCYEREKVINKNPLEPAVIIKCNSQQFSVTFILVYFE